MTKEQYYNKISQICKTALCLPDFEDEYDEISECIAFCAEEICRLNLHKEKRASKSDPLKEDIYTLISTIRDYGSAEEILVVIQKSYPEATKQQVSARLVQLVKEGRAQKKKVKNKNYYMGVN